MKPSTAPIPLRKYHLPVTYVVAILYHIFIDAQWVKCFLHRRSPNTTRTLSIPAVRLVGTASYHFIRRLPHRRYRNTHRTPTPTPCVGTDAVNAEVADTVRTKSQFQRKAGALPPASWCCSYWHEIAMCIASGMCGCSDMEICCNCCKKKCLCRG